MFLLCQGSQIRVLLVFFLNCQCWSCAYTHKHAQERCQKRDSLWGTRMQSRRRGRRGRVDAADIAVWDNLTSPPPSSLCHFSICTPESRHKKQQTPHVKDGEVKPKGRGFEKEHETGCVNFFHSEAWRRQLEVTAAFASAGWHRTQTHPRIIISSHRRHILWTRRWQRRNKQMLPLKWTIVRTTHEPVFGRSHCLNNSGIRQSTRALHSSLQQRQPVDFISVMNSKNGTCTCYSSSAAGGIMRPASTKHTESLNRHCLSESWSPVRDKYN